MLYHPPTQSLLLRAPDPLLVREVIPKSRVLDHTEYNLAVKYTIDSVQVLKNLGLDVPAPIHLQYRWPGKYTPFDHQRVMAEFLASHHRAFNLSEMGTGKSAATLWAADWLMTRKRIKSALILSPLSTIERVWQQDIFDVLMHRVVSMVYGSRADRLEALETPADFYIMNHDGVAIAPVAEAIRRKPEIGLVVIDEASMFRNASTRRFKALQAMLRPDQRVWLLTGTPCPNAPTDAWALAKIVGSPKVPRHFGAFQRATMMQVTPFKWVPRIEGYATAFEAMQPAVRFKKAECLDLPPVTTQDWQAQTTQEQNAAFQTMRTWMQAEASKTKITAANAADKINKLRQILCGVVKDTATEEYLPLPHQGRVKVLLEAIQSASAKVLVVVPFKGIINALEKEVGEHHSVAVLNGDVSPKVRNKIISDFKTQADPHVLLCHPKVMAHGLNLTEADTLVFYAPIYSNDEFQQVTERFNRAGQTRKMTIIRIGAHPLEWAIYKMVDTKGVTQNNILNLYKTVVE